MTTFDVYVNGRRKCTAGIDGAGVVVSALTWTASGSPDDEQDLDLRIGGLISRTQTHVDWFHDALKAGDEVKIVVLEKPRADRPKQRRRESVATRLHREQRYLERKAAEFGWQIVK